MKDGGGQRGIGMSGFAEDLDKMLGASGASRCNHRDANSIPHGSRELAIEPNPGAVVIHRSEQDLARTPLLGLFGPFDRVAAGGLASTVDKHPESSVGALGVNGDNGSLRSEALARLP